MIIGVLLLWVILMVILGRGAHKAFKAQKKREGAVLTIVFIVILLFTGEWALFLAFMLGCFAGLPLPCHL